MVSVVEGILGQWIMKSGLEFHEHAQFIAVERRQEPAEGILRTRLILGWQRGDWTGMRGFWRIGQEYSAQEDYQM